MPPLLRKPVTQLWSELNWMQGRLVRSKAVTEPLRVPEAPISPGLYRLTWQGAEDWHRLTKIRFVKASKKLMDPRLALITFGPQSF